MPRKPGGKYKGKIPRAKGEATIAAELEAKRRKAYEANLAKLQERRQQELLAEQGMQSDEEEAQALKLAKLAQMFGSGKKGMLQKFWKNWKIGIVSMRKEKAIEERKFCWRTSCNFCNVIPGKIQHRHGEFGPAAMGTCKNWWSSTFDREHWGNELHPIEAAKDRPDIVNRFRSCTCCGVDTGLPGLGCRSWTMLRDVGFMRPSEVEEKLPRTELGKSKNLHVSLGKFGMSGSMSTPSLRMSKSQGLNLSVDANWTKLKNDSDATYRGVPEYDPTEAFVLSPSQTLQEERRAWSDGLSAMAGSPPTRVRSGQLGQTMLGQTMLPKIGPFVPNKTEQGEQLDEVVHWRTGQKTMLDKHMAKMYVVGVQ